MSLTRRTFLGTVGTVLAGSTLPRSIHALDLRPPNRMGVQLYTVRDAMQRDFAGTLERIAAIGYTDVEFAGYFGRSPSQVRGVIERAGLAAPSSHVGFELIQDDWPGTLGTARDAGHAYVTIPWLPDGVRRTRADWSRIAAQFNRAGEAARAAGLRLAYHNQAYDLVPVDGVRPLDLLLAETEPELVAFQLDVYWLFKAGGDPVSYLRQHPGRVAMTHLKDSAGPPAHVMRDVGSGTLDFARILAAAAQSGVQHHFVEHDEPVDAFASLRASFAHLAALRDARTSGGGRMPPR